MLRSYVIDIDGRFVGAAVRQPNGFRFVAVDVRLDALDGGVWPSLAELERRARNVVVADAHERATPAVN